MAGFIESSTDMPRRAPHFKASEVSRSPECDAEEQRSTGVDSENEADVVAAPDVVGGVNRKVLSRQQSWQCRGHHGSVDEAGIKSGNVILAIIPFGRPVISDAQKHSEQHERYNFNGPKPDNPAPV